MTLTSGLVDTGNLALDGVCSAFVPYSLDRGDGASGNA
jgi:hypothetical protein